MAKFILFIYLIIFLFISSAQNVFAKNTCERFESVILNEEVASHSPFFIDEDFATLNNFGFTIDVKPSQPTEENFEIFINDFNPYFKNNKIYKNDKLIKINGYEINAKALLAIRQLIFEQSFYIEENYAYDLKYLLSLGLIEKSNQIKNIEIEKNIFYEPNLFAQVDIKDKGLLYEIYKNYNFRDIGKVTLTLEREGELIDIEVITKDYYLVPSITTIVDFLNIEKIDSKNNIFTANYYLELHRFDHYHIGPLLANEFKREINQSYISFECIWNSLDDADIFGQLKYIWFPEYSFVNRIGFDTDKINQQIKIVFNVGQEFAIIEFREIGLADFTTDFSVQTFPFDKQKVRMEIANHDGAGDGIIGTYLINEVLFNVQLLTGDNYALRKYNDPRNNFNNDRLSGWQLGNKNSYQNNHILWQGKDTEDQITTVFGVEQTIHRASFYFVFKLFSPILLILLICWSVFWTKSKELESRLTVTITCFLALVAYTFVIDDELPKLEFLTLMDRVILTSYIFAAIPTLLSIIAHRINFYSETKAQSIDKFSIMLGPSLYVFVVYLIFISMASNNMNNTSQFLKGLTFN